MYINNKNGRLFVLFLILGIISFFMFVIKTDLSKGILGNVLFQGQAEYLDTLVYHYHTFTCPSVVTLNLGDGYKAYTVDRCEVTPFVFEKPGYYYSYKMSYTDGTEECFILPPDKVRKKTLKPREKIGLYYFTSSGKPCVNRIDYAHAENYGFYVSYFGYKPFTYTISITATDVTKGEVVTIKGNINKAATIKIYIDGSLVDTIYSSSNEFTYRYDSSYLTIGDHTVKACIEGTGVCDSTSFRVNKMVCDAGWLKDKKCYGDIVQRKWRKTDCTVEWRNYEDCSEYSGFVGSKYCSDDGVTVVQKYREYYCSLGECKYIEIEKSLETCSYKCENGKCVKKQIICNPGEYKCFDNYRKMCSSDGTEWITVEICDYKCENGVCIEKPIPPPQPNIIIQIIQAIINFFKAIFSW